MIPRPDPPLGADLDQRPPGAVLRYPSAMINAHGTLTPNIVASVSIPVGVVTVTVTNRSQAGEIYFTTDGTIPTVGGTNCFVCLGSRTVSASGSQVNPGTLQLISSTAAKYSIENEGY